MTIEVNKETLDYLRAELSESVRKSTEDTLFRYYRKAFSLVVAVLAAAGITVGWPLFQSMVKAEIDNGVRAPVEEAKNSATEMQTQVARIQATTDISLDRIKTQLVQAEAKADAADDALRKAQGKVLAASHQFDDQIARINAELTDVEAAVASRSQSLGDKFAPAGGFNALLHQVSDLSTQVQTLDTALRSLASGLGKSDAVAATVEVPNSVQSIKNAVSAQALPSVQTTTVFVQFAGGARSQITALTDLLKAGGYTVPGEERIGDAAGKHEIRYFYAEDAPAAASLEAAVQAAMAQLNYPRRPITLVPLLSFAKKPQRNVVELWLEVPP